MAAPASVRCRQGSCCYQHSIVKGLASSQDASLCMLTFGTEMVAPTLFGLKINSRAQVLPGSTEPVVGVMLKCGPKDGTSQAKLVSALPRFSMSKQRLICMPNSLSFIANVQMVYVTNGAAQAIEVQSHRQA